MSQFLYLYRMTETARQENMGTPERAQQNMQRWMKWMNDLDARGHLKDRGQPLEQVRNPGTRSQLLANSIPIAPTSERRFSATGMAGFSMVVPPR